MYLAAKTNRRAPST